jgi:hypothetical protein
MNNSASQPQGEIPKDIFEKFLAGLAESDVPREVVERLRQTIADQSDLSEKAIKTALFQSDPTND